MHEDEAVQSHYALGVEHDLFTRWRGHLNGRDRRSS